jgi:Ca2+-binding RTX toxin-like protein
MLPASLALAAIPAAGATPRCFGEKATIVGTRRADSLTGTRRADVIVGLGGDDLIDGRGGADLICGGRGLDVSLGGKGDDRIDGGGGFFNSALPGPGDDYVDGGPGGFDDVWYVDAKGPIVGDLGTDTVTGLGTDTVANVEQIVGGSFDDILTGDDGVNILVGMGGNDQLFALAGDVDFLAGGPDDDLLDGGDGPDNADYYEVNAFWLGTPLAGPVTVDLPAGTGTGEGNDTLVSIEGASGSQGDDVMIGDAADNDFESLFEGSDTVTGGDGNDFIDGGEGADDLDGGAGIDLLSFYRRSEGATVDLAAASDSDGDALAGIEDIQGSNYDDVLGGDDAANSIFGGPGADTLTGLGGDDVLIGNGGTDSADGGLGNDACDAETETACEAVPTALTARQAVLSILQLKASIW